MSLQKFLLLLAILLSINGPNQATCAATLVLDFDSLPASLDGGIDVGNPLVEDGFRLFDPSVTERFDYFLSLADGWQNNRGSSNGTTTVSKLTNNNSHVAFELSAVSGNAFDLISIDVAETFNVGDFYFYSAARTVFFTGKLSGGGTVGQSFDLDLISDGQGGQDDFETVLLNPAFKNLVSVEITAFSGDPDLTYFNFDNIVVSLVPEPTILVLALMALAPLCVYRPPR